MKNVLGRSVDATEGSIFRGIILYAIPLILSSLVQVFFNAVDLVVVGNMADSRAVASVGATSTVISLLLNAFIGLSNGAKIVLSRLFGSKNSRSIQACADTVIITAIGMGLLITLIGISLAPSLLRWTNCPEDCFDGALLYINIYLCGAPMIVLYNFSSSILTASGDSRRPMVAIICGGLGNVFLNILLCLILQEKVAAVAIATVISQVIAAFIVMYRLCTVQGDGHIDWKSMRFHKASFWQLMRNGIPIAITSMVFPVANVMIQAAINQYGTSATAGSTTANQLQNIVLSFTGALSSTALVFMGQNIGAMKPERVSKAFRYSLLLSVSCGFALGGGMFLMGRYLCLAFLPNDPDGVEYAMIQMMFLLLPYWVGGANGVLQSAIQAFGHVKYAAVSSILSVCVFRIIWMKLVYPFFENYYVLMACYLVSWLVQLCFNMVGYFRFFWKGYKTN